jgi:S1-C subfamily serine protease
VPVNLAKEVMTELIHAGHVTRGWLGISLGKLTDEVRQALKYPQGDGAPIAAVIRGGPGHTAGLRPGDIIISVDGKKVTGPSEALGVTSKLKPETAYPISVIRDGETLDFRVVIGKRPVKNLAQDNNTSKVPQHAER